MLDREDYPNGVPCWVDLVQPDFDRLTDFYRGLFGWTFEVRTPPDVPQRYAYALVDGRTVAGVGGGPASDREPAGWTNYVRVESADKTAELVEANGGRVVAPPVDIPRSGRVALSADPGGAPIGLWQPAELRGAQLVNAPGSWNFSELHTADPDRAKAFYGEVFGWVCTTLDLGPGMSALLWRVPGYGEFLASRDPELRERMAANQAPDGFEDAIAWLVPDDATRTARWSVTFAVADADAAFEHATTNGAAVVTPLFDTPYTREGVVRDPQGAELTLSEYRPPAPD